MIVASSIIFYISYSSPDTYLGNHSSENVEGIQVHKKVFRKLQPFSVSADANNFIHRLRNVPRLY